MFTFAASPFHVGETLSTMCRATWEGLAGPGSSWSGAERLAIAARARATRIGLVPGHDELPEPAREAIRVLAAVPAGTTEQWVSATVGGLGEPAYVELVGVVARVVAVDTFTRLLGVTPEPLPEPRPGSPAEVPPVGTPRRGRAWVAMTDVPVPPNVLSLVPPAQSATNATAVALYMTGAQMDDPDTTIDGLHRTQIEVVATSVSHANECFY
jgi:hypothetical protein